MSVSRTPVWLLVMLCRHELMRYGDRYGARAMPWPMAALKPGMTLSTYANLPYKSKVRERSSSLIISRLSDKSSQRPPFALHYAL